MFCRINDPKFEEKKLTKQEENVAVLWAHGSPLKELAWSLHISPKTAEAHLSSIYRKIGATDRYEVICWAVRNGLHEEFQLKPKAAAGRAAA